MIEAVDRSQALSGSRVAVSELDSLELARVGSTAGPLESASV